MGSETEESDPVLGVGYASKLQADVDSAWEALRESCEALARFRTEERRMADSLRAYERAKSESLENELLDMEGQNHEEHLRRKADELPGEGAS